MIGDIPRIKVLTEPFRRIVRDVRAVADNRRNAPRRRKAVPDTRRDLQQRVVVRPAEQHFHDPPARRGLGAVVIQDNLQLPHREQGADIYAFTQSQIQDYCRKAAALGLPWSSDGIRY